MLKSLLCSLTAAAALSMISALAQAHPGIVNTCSGPDDPDPCIVKSPAPDLSRLPVAGPAAWVAGNRLVLSWVGPADTVRVTGSASGLLNPIPLVTDNVHQLVIQFKQADQVHMMVNFLVTKDGKNESGRLPGDLAGSAAAPAIQDSRVAPRTVVFSGSSIQAHVWLPPGYRAGQRYPILYLADGGGTSPGSLLTSFIQRGEIAPVIVVGVDYCAPDAQESNCRMRSYLTPGDGPVPEEFLAHERFLVETVIPGIEAQFGAPPERRLRAIGGASNGGVWTASMALRHSDVFGTAFVMSPGVRPAPHPEGASATRFYVAAGLLERGFWWRAQCIAGDIVDHGGTATLVGYPSGHDPWMWGHILADNVKDWLSPQPAAVVPAPPASASCKPAVFR